MPDCSRSIRAVAIWIALAAAVALAAACRDRSGEPSPPPPSFAPPAGDGLLLEVGPSVRADLRLLSQRFYAEPDLAPLFARLEREGDRYCRMFYDLEPRDLDRMADFVGPAERYFTTAYNTKWNSRAGCWNYYQSNDRQVWTDFDLVRRLYPATGYDCYAIGLPQPYIMHNHLGCHDLTLVDFDWRIQDTHRRLLGWFRDRQITDLAALHRALATLPLKWVAYGEPPPQEGGASPRTSLCERARTSCEAELLRFQDNFASLATVRLSLAALHELDLRPRNPQLLRVIYLSNALADQFTSYREFRRFLANLTGALAEDERLILIQHVGGRNDFAVYELSSAADSYQIVTRCHDFYRADQPDHGGRVPATWLDLTTTSRGQVAGCHDLL